jgi:hypothetical protein
MDVERKLFLSPHLVVFLGVFDQIQKSYCLFCFHEAALLADPGIFIVMHP